MVTDTEKTRRSMGCQREARLSASPRALTSRRFRTQAPGGGEEVCEAGPGHMQLEASPLSGAILTARALLRKKKMCMSDDILWKYLFSLLKLKKTMSPKRLRSLGRK